MTLREELVEPIYGIIHDHNYDYLSDGELTDTLVEVVWAVLEKKVGTVQEKLMNDLSQARTERDAALRKVDWLNVQLLSAQQRLSEYVEN